MTTTVVFFNKGPDKVELSRGGSVYCVLAPGVSVDMSVWQDGGEIEVKEIKPATPSA